MLKFYCGVINGRKKDRGTRGSVGLWSEGPRATGALLCAKCLNVCSKSEPGGSVVVC